MKRRRKRKIKWVRVIFCLFLIIILLGGGILIFNSFYHKKNNNVVNKNKEVKEEKKEETSDRDVIVNLEKAPSNHLEFSKLSDGEYVTDRGFTLKIKDGVAYIDDNIIVNKTYSLPSSYKPHDSYQEVVGERCNNCINKDAMEAFKLMASDAKSVGLNIYISSGYRSYSYQDKLYNNYVSISGKEKADTYSARPGHSEHQTGECFDLNTIDDSFQYTDEGKWVNENAYLYGFIIRYPKGKESITGYQYESWHLRYVGKERAQMLYHDGSWETLEEYYGISSSYE